MHDRLYVEDKYPLSVVTFEEDGQTPATADEATVDIYDQASGLKMVDAGTCDIDEGLVTYWIMPDSSVSTIPGRYVAFFRVELNELNIQTHRVPFNVLQKGSDLIIEKWLAKVRDSAPSEDHTTEDHARDWVDAAVAHMGKHYQTQYTSLLATITALPGTDAPGANEIEFFADVAALMARTAWWAGKGNWRDEEMSLDTGPFWREWNDLKSLLDSTAGSEWYSGTFDQHNMYNRDKVDVWGHPDVPDDYLDAAWLRDEE